MDDQPRAMGGSSESEGGIPPAAPRQPLLSPEGQESLGDGLKRDRLMAALALMIGIGLTALVLATVEHRQSMSALRTEYGTVPYSLATVVASLIAILGVAGLMSVLLHW